VPITAKQPGQQESNRRCGFYFRDQNKTVAASCGKREADVVFLRRPTGRRLQFSCPVAGADSVATVQVEAQETAELVLAVTKSLALFRLENRCYCSGLP